MQVAMLGPLEVRDNAGAVLEVGGARLRGLLIMLALRPGQLVTASQLIEALWGEQPPAEPGNALQALVSRLRRAVPEAEIEARPSGYRLMLDPEATDVVRFERLAAHGHQQLREDPARAARTLREALALWRGPALADVADGAGGGTRTGAGGGTGTGGAHAVIARLDELRLSATQDRITADLRLGGARELIAELSGLTAAYPTREPLAGLLMRALRASGQRNAALEAYERTRRRLADQLGMDPSAELAALHLELLQADADVPSTDLRSADPQSTNLPVALSSFVGRDDELSQVAGLLAVHRLVTLTGPGGAGKTRLAVETARGQLPRMPDGVWLVELAPVSDPAEVAAAVLGALGLREQTVLYRGSIAPRGTGPEGRLISALTAKRTLIVLDNCEHLITAAAILAEKVLSACPQVRILATSREPLNITGEALAPVGPLALRPATSLLEQRACAVSPGFALTTETAPAAERICLALDGMPLAIELAAARIRTMDPEQVATRLDDRFRLLTGGSRTALPRHQTLRAVVDWSWDLLDDAEQALWRRFSVFSGGATLDAATAVCAGGSVSKDDVLDVLTALADKSVLTVRQGRYWMLEIIRAYGQVRLAETGEREQLRAAHAAYFLQLADEARDHLFAAEQLDWLRLLADDQENLHAAIRGAVAAGDGETAIGLTGSLGWYWWLRSMKAEGAELAADALALADDTIPVERLATGYTMGGMMAFDTPHFEQAPGWFQRATELAAKIDASQEPLVRLAAAVNQLLGSTFQHGWTAAPASMFDAVVADEDPFVSAIGRAIRGQVMLNFGTDLDQAEEDFRLGYAGFAGIGERWGMAMALDGLATMADRRGDFKAAIAHHVRAIELTAELGTIEDEGQFRVYLARELWLDGQRDQAAIELDRALRQADRIGWPESQALAAYTAGELARHDGQLDVARTHLVRATEVAAAPGVAAQQRAAIRTACGILAATEGDLGTARGLHEEAWELVQPTGDGPRIAEVLVGRADQALREADPGRAAELLGQAVAVRGTTDRSDFNGFTVEAQARALLGEAGFVEAFNRGFRRGA